MFSLTDQQQRIVAHNRGPALVFAVAGAGKTTAMVHRVERLVREGVFAPQKILVSSFNKSAVDALGRTLAPWPHCNKVERRTLHALGYRIVVDAARRGLLPGLDCAPKVNGEERQLVWAARDRARQRNLIPAGELDSIDDQDLLAYIGACKGNLRYPDFAAANLPPTAASIAGQAAAPANLPWYLELYRLHEVIRQERGWISFDDMLMLGWEMLVRFTDLRASWQRAYDAILVDEFQDVNLAQSEILHMLSAPHGNYMVIGDDDQTIYSFRGANMAFLRSFAKRYTASVYEMTDNFRCRAAQVLLANNVIGQNRERHPKTLVATQGFGGSTTLRNAPDAAAMARQIVADITAAQAAGHSLNEIAILVRLTAQTPPIEQALIAAGFGYKIAGEEPFYLRREITDLLRYPQLAKLDAALRAGQPLSVADAEQFSTLWRGIYNRPKRYLPRQLFQDSLQAVLSQNVPLSAVLIEMSSQVPQRLATTLRELAELLCWLADAQAQLPADELLRGLDQSLSYSDFLRQNSGLAETGAGYAANVAAFILYANGKGNLVEFQTHLGLLAQEGAALAASSSGVDIRTIHRAKGLEWTVVLVPNCNAGTIPYGDPANLEEERRLLYVAITRAKQQLRLYTLSGRDAKPSPFLRDAQIVIQRADETERLLASLATWTAADALSVLRFPREFGQERLFSVWWPAPTALREQIARRVIVFAQAAAARDATERLGIAASDLELWRSLAPGDDAQDGQPFAGLDALCAQSTKATPRPEPAASAPYTVGERVAHTVFGIGVVVSVDAVAAGRRREWHLSVQFANRKLIRLLADIAPLEKL